MTQHYLTSHHCPLYWLSVLFPSTVAAVFLGLISAVFAFAQDRHIQSEDIVIERATEAWLDGSIPQALDIIQEGIREQSDSLALQKLRGDILATTRRNQEALENYEAILKQSPEYLPARWAKWGVLTRLGQGDQAIDELERIAQYTPTNPLVPLRLAQELRKLDRLEESVEWYKKAVALVPDMPGWRLNMARALFDVLQYDNARKEVQHVLKQVSPGSPVEMAARNLLMITFGATKERGRRYQPIFSPGGTAEERKRWALIRHQGWEHFAKGRYKEAEPILRELFALNPTDHRVTYELGSTLMELGHHEEAVTLLQKSIELGPGGDNFSEVFLDSIFRIGQSLVALERWEEALLHFEILQEIATVPPENQNTSQPGEHTREPGPPDSEKNANPTPTTVSGKIIDEEKLAPWFEKVRQHLPEQQQPVKDANQSLPAADPTDIPSDYYTKLAAKKFTPDELFHTRASLMGRDADFSWFRFVIPAEGVLRDDLQVGSHEFIPIDTTDTFFDTREEIYLVFALVTASYDAVSLTAQCYLETSPIIWGADPLSQDHVIMSTNEQTGYFVLSPPKTGWTPGFYRCGLFVGDTVSAYTQSDEVRFRVMEPNQPS